MSQEELSSEEPACRPGGLRYFLSHFLAAARHSSASDSFMASRNVPRTSGMCDFDAVYILHERDRIVLVSDIRKLRLREIC